MALFLRKVRKSRWYRTEKVSWLPDNDLQADALDDLRTKDNELSVYNIDENESNLDRAIAALAANSEHPSNLDFATFGQEILSEIGIKVRSSRGESPDDQVNSWHCDLYQLSASKLLELARAIKAKARIERKGHKQILDLVADSLAMGKIDRTKMEWGKADLDRIDEIITARRSRTLGTQTNSAL